MNRDDTDDIGLLDARTRRLIDRAREYERKATKRLERLTAKYTKQYYTESMRITMERREAKVDMYYYENERDKIARAGSVLPKEFIAIMEAEELKVKLAEEKKKREKQEAMEKVKARAIQSKIILEKLREARLSVYKDTKSDRKISKTAKSVANQDDSEFGESPTASITVPKPKTKTTRFKVAGNEQDSKYSDVSFDQESELDVSVPFARKPTTHVSFAEVAPPPKPVPQREIRKQRREDFIERFLDPHDDYFESERVKNMRLPPWLVSKLQEHREVASKEHTQYQKVTEEEEEKRTTAEQEAYDYFLSKTNEPEKAQQMTKIMLQKYFGTQRVPVRKIIKPKKLPSVHEIKRKSSVFSREDSSRLMTPYTPYTPWTPSPEVSASELLDCSYLRLTKNNVKTLERRAADEDGHVGLHAHMTQGEVTEFYSKLENIRQIFLQTERKEEVKDKIEGSWQHRSDNAYALSNVMGYVEPPKPEAIRMARLSRGWESIAESIKGKKKNTLGDIVKKSVKQYTATKKRESKFSGRP